MDRIFSKIFYNKEKIIWLLKEFLHTHINGYVAKACYNELVCEPFIYLYIDNIDMKE
jgi:hypothetical protein